MRRKVSLGSEFVLAACVLVIGAITSPATAQNYMFGQTSLQTGTKPSGVAVADFNGDGRLDLAVVNQGDNTVSVILTKPDGTFARKVDYPVGNAAAQVATADFNGDGITDLAVVNSADNAVSILLGVGDGTFQSQITFPTGRNPVAIVAGDFNSDGNVDLAVANQMDDNVSVLLGDGKGAFTSQSPIAINGAPYSMLIGDANSDGKMDLLVLANVSNSGDILLLLTSNGKGEFSVSGITQQNPINNIALGDFNDDGFLDVALANSPTESVSIFFGDGTGSFYPQSVVAFSYPGATPEIVAAGDFNHDGNLDLALTQTYFIAIYPGNGDGTFGTPSLGGVPSSTTPVTLIPADFNNDSQLDLAVLIPDDDAAVVLLGNGDGTLASRYDFVITPAAPGYASAVVADLNKDGKQDLALAQFNQPAQGPIQGFISTLLGNGDGTFQTAISTPSSDVGTGDLISGDFVGNGTLDLASANVDGVGGVAVFLGNGDGTLGLPIDSFSGGATTILNLGPVAAGDFNRDGKMDLIVASENDGNSNSPLYVLLSQGDGTFEEKFIYNLAYGSGLDVAVADFNEDGFLDLAVTTGQEMLVFLGLGDGTFHAPTPFTYYNYFPNGVAVGDFNRDGTIDIVVGAGPPGEFVFFAGNGDGTFKKPIVTATLTNIGTLRAGDFNGDGILDLITEGPGWGDSIFLGNGDGTFQAAVPFNPTYQSKEPYTVGDLNGDGAVDLVQFSASGLTASVWLSTPTPSFTASSLQFDAQNVGTSSPPRTIQLSNVGNAPLALAKIAANGDFSQTSACASTLAIKDNCAIQVTFTPTANGLRNGALMFTDNIKPGTQTVALVGWAGPPDFVASVSPASVTVNAGLTATYSLTVTSGDGFVGTVQASCSGAPHGSTCTLTQQSVTLSANTFAKIKVTVSTTAGSSAFIRPPYLIPTKWSYQALNITSIFGMMIICLAGALAHRSKRRVFTVLPTVAFVIALSACGSGSGTAGPPNGGTPTGNYTLTVSLTSGRSTHMTQMTLIVH